MKIATLMTVSVLALGLASPAFAQSSNGGSGTIQSGFGNDSTTVNDLLDLYAQDSNNNTNTNSGNSADTANFALGNTLDSGNVTGSNQVTANQELTATITNRGAMNFNGGNGGDADADADSSAAAAAAGSIVFAGVGTASSSAAASGSAAAGDGGDGETDYSSGNNSVNDMAFAAYAGIMTQGWNTGINANVQAGTNIAAQGTVNFGPN
jgi:hypothetical protein